MNDKMHASCIWVRNSIGDTAQGIQKSIAAKRRAPSL